MLSKLSLPRGQKQQQRIDMFDGSHYSLKHTRCVHLPHVHPYPCRKDLIAILHHTTQHPY